MPLNSGQSSVMPTNRPSSHEVHPQPKWPNSPFQTSSNPAASRPIRR